MKIINVGAYPPPYGGVSIHLKRLKYHLDAAGNENVLLDCSSHDKEGKGIVRTQAFLTHIHFLRIDTDR